MGEQWYRIEYMDDPEAEGACMSCNADGVKYIPVTIDYEAIKAVTTRAVRLGNNMAAHNSGMGDDEIEAEGKEYADDIMELLGSNDE